MVISENITLKLTRNSRQTASSAAVENLASTVNILLFIMLAICMLIIRFPLSRYGNGIGGMGSAPPSTNENTSGAGGTDAGQQYFVQQMLQALAGTNTQVEATLLDILMQQDEHRTAQHKNMPISP